MPFVKGQKKPQGSGRTSGVPNKRTARQNEAIKAFVDAYLGSEQMDKDFKSLEPRDRLIIAERYASHVYPKPQSVDVTLSNIDDRQTIEQRLIELSSSE